MSKGSKIRPSQVPMEQVDNNWDKIFGKKTKDTKCEGECYICIKNPDSEQVLQIAEPVEETVS